MMRTVTPELLRELSRYPRYPRSAADLVRIAGWEGAARLISTWRGQEWPVPMREGGATPAGVRRYQQLVELIGDPAARRVVAEWRGQKLYVPSMKEVLADYIAQKVRDEFDELTAKGYSAPEAVFELGINHDISGRWVEKLIASPNAVLAAVRDDVQGSLFGWE